MLQLCCCPRADSIDAVARCSATSSAPGADSSWRQVPTSRSQSCRRRSVGSHLERREVSEAAEAFRVGRPSSDIPAVWSLRGESGSGEIRADLEGEGGWLGGRRTLHRRQSRAPREARRQRPRRWCSPRTWTDAGTSFHCTRLSCLSRRNRFGMLPVLATPAASIWWPTPRAAPSPFQASRNCRMGATLPSMSTRARAPVRGSRHANSSRCLRLTPRRGPRPRQMARAACAREISKRAKACGSTGLILMLAVLVAESGIGRN